MSNKDTQEFIKAWLHFETTLKGKLRPKINDQEVSENYANIILNDVATIWFSSYGTEGLWLTNYQSLEPEKGKRIYTILKNELKFSSTINKKQSNQYVKYAVPAAGAIIGGSIAKAVTSNILLKCASIAAPVAILYPIAKEYESSKEKDMNKNILDNYINQIQDCKSKIISIIEN